MADKYEQMIDDCEARESRLSEWEAEFIDSLRHQLANDGTLPLGRLANRDLRAAKMRAHAAFDSIWRSGEMTRPDAYLWLAGQLGISVPNCHIGEFDIDGCDAVCAVVAARKQSSGS